MLKTIFGNYNWPVENEQDVYSFNELDALLGKRVVRSSLQIRFDEVGAAVRAGRFGEALVKAFPGAVDMATGERNDLHPLRYYKEEGRPGITENAYLPEWGGENAAGRAWYRSESGTLNPHLNHIVAGRVENVSRKGLFSGPSEGPAPVPAIDITAHHVGPGKVIVNASAPGFTPPRNRLETAALLEEAGAVIDAARNDRPYDFDGMADRLAAAGLRPLASTDAAPAANGSAAKPATPAGM
jgi:hypothetical protein